MLSQSCAAGGFLLLMLPPYSSSFMRAIKDASIPFQLLKRERIRKHIYANRQEARSDVFSYIEMFYNPIRRHSFADGMSPVEYERRHSVRPAAI